MDKFKRSQILKFLVVAAFLIITPLLSASSRPPYMYFIVNLLIIALGAEAGLLSCIFKAAEDKKPAATVTVTQKPLITSEATKSDKEKATNATTEVADSVHANKIPDSDHVKPKAKGVEKCSSEKIAVSVKVNRVKRCPSTPSIFFIGGGETEPEDFVEDDDQEDVGELSGQELFHKAETFIGNFYKQSKMQREDSWNKLHELYQKSLLS